MTNQEAIDDIQNNILPVVGGKSLLMAIEALKAQEPVHPEKRTEERTKTHACDLISRRDAIDLWEKYHPYIAIKACEYDAKLRRLPSVQPERPKGEWIPVDSYRAFGGDEATWMAHGNPVAFYYCSECKEQAYAGEDGESLITDYCPNCGADMRCERNESD